MLLLFIITLIITLYFAITGIMLICEDMFYWDRIVKDLEYKIDMLNRSNNSKE